MPDFVSSRALPFVFSIGERRQRSIVEALLARADVRVGGQRPWDIRVHHDRFFRRVLANGDLGLGESYMDGDWSCDRVDEMASRLFAAGVHHVAIRTIEVLIRLIARIIS